MAVSDITRELARLGRVMALEREGEREGERE